MSRGWKAAGLLALAAVFRLAWMSQVVFPPLDDPAFYLTVARNVVGGRGMVIDALWSYQFPFESVTHPSNEYWMPLASFLMLPLASVLGPTLQSAQLTGAALGALLAPATYLLGRASLEGDPGREPVALGAGLLLALNPLLAYQSVSADSSAPYALLSFLALVAIWKAGDGGGRAAFLSGVLVGLSYLARPDGLGLAAVACLIWLRPGGKRLPSRSWGLAGLGLALVAGPWWARNALAFGSPLPVSLGTSVFVADYLDTFGYPAPPPVVFDWPTLLALRLAGLIHNLRDVFIVITFPWGLFVPFGIWAARRAPGMGPALLYGLLLFLGSALVLPIQTMAGLYYHSVGGTLPFLALGTLLAFYRAGGWLRRRLGLRAQPYLVFLAACVALLLAQTAIAWPAAGQRHRSEAARFAEVAAWVREQATPPVVVTDQPYTVHYASGAPAIPLPGNQPPEAVLAAARRYGADYLILTQVFGRYPEAIRQTDAFEPVYRGRSVEIYRIRR